MTSVLVIAGSFAAWSVVHSVLASQWMKSSVQKLVGPGVKRWYRVLFVIFATVTLVPILGATLLMPDGVLYTVPPPWRWLMVLGQIGALAALAVSLFQAGLWHFVGLAQLTAEDPDRTGDLQVRGLYRYVRHPLYLFSILLIWLTPTMTRNLAALFASMTAYFIVGSYHEEALLVAQFGDAYHRYRQQVPRFVPMPGISYRGQGGGDRR